MSDASDTPPGPPKWPTAPPVGYPGITEPITFDYELDAPTTAEDEGGPVTDDGGPSLGYRERWRSIARLHALGKRNGEIAEFLQYTESRISLLLNEPWVQQEVRHYRAQFDSDVSSIVKEAAVDGARTIHRMILDPKTKDSVAADLSKWAVEKATGKATQQVNVQNNTLGYFVDLMKRMQSRGESLPTEREALPPAQQSDSAGDDTRATQSSWDGWLDSNL